MGYFYTKMCLFDNKIISKKYLHFNNPSAVQLRPIYALCMVHLRFMSDLLNQKKDLSLHRNLQQVLVAGSGHSRYTHPA